MEYRKLFEPNLLCETFLKNRIVMAPMTRSRCTEPGGIPNDLMAEYYAQRASVGLIITEACQVSLQGQGYARTPGIYSREQIEGWKKVTSAVHAKNGRIFLQLWHVGRVGSARVNGLTPIAPSALTARDTKVYIFEDVNGQDATFIPVDPPREMTLEDIHVVISQFAQGASNAMKAGFDGVEIHGANGYLIDQFLRSNSNRRKDGYGGGMLNRLRLLQDISWVVADRIGPDRVGVRLSPFIKVKDMEDPLIFDTIKLSALGLDALGVAYLHLCEADWEDAPDVPTEFRRTLRSLFTRSIIATGNKTPEEGEQLLQDGLVDYIGFGRAILANPDFPRRIYQHSPLNKITDTHTLFGGGGARGYTDYPFLD